MVAWIVYFKENALKNQGYIDFHIVEGKKIGIDVKLILVEDLEFGVEKSRLFIKHQGRDISHPDFVISRSIYPLLSKHLEAMGIKVFNNSFVSEICNDKAKTYQYLAKTGIEMVYTKFYRNNQVNEIFTKAKKPMVIKAVDGHGGTQVFLYEPSMDDVSDIKYKDQNSMNIQSILQGLGSSDIVVQPLIGSRHQDLRVYIIGTEIIASVLRTAKEGFKSNYSLGGEVKLYNLSEEEKSIVYTIIDQFNFGLVGIDFIIGDHGELIFNEIEDVVGSRMLYQYSDINIVEKHLKFICDSLNQV